MAFFGDSIEGSMFSQLTCKETQSGQCMYDSGGLSYLEVEVSVTMLRIKFQLQKVDVHTMLKINLWEK